MSGAQKTLEALGHSKPNLRKVKLGFFHLINIYSKTIIDIINVIINILYFTKEVILCMKQKKKQKI